MFRKHPEITSIVHVHTLWLGGWAQTHRTLRIKYAASQRLTLSRDIPAHIDRSQAPGDFILDRLVDDPDLAAIFEANGGVNVIGRAGLLDLANFVVLLEEGAQYQALGELVGGSVDFDPTNLVAQWGRSGLLERHLSDVEWVDLRELPAPPRADPRTGLPTLHSDWLFDEGGYDFIGTGFTPPITGLGQGRDLVYVGISGPRVENGRLVSLENSGIRTVADLRGKRVGIAHGSRQTTLALLALDREGQRWSDIVPVDIDVNDGGAALLRGDLDEQQHCADLLYASDLLPRAADVPAAGAVDRRGRRGESFGHSGPRAHLKHG